jgi:hypothetical protein
MSSNECIQAVKEAAEGKLTDDELEEVFTRAQQIHRRLIAEGKTDNLDQRMADAIEKDAERTKVAAALQRKHAAMNAIVRDRISNHIGDLRAAGLTPEKAVLAMFEGSIQGVKAGRVSVYATRQAYETKFIGRMLAELDAERPHLKTLMNDDDFAKDVVREMAELKEGGKPGRTENSDAMAVAEVFSKYGEISRQELNRLGAGIGKLDGWAGPQRHDADRLSKAGEANWVDFIKQHLDFDRTFEGVNDASEIDKILKGVYREIITGQGSGLNSRAKGEFTGPASLAKAMSKSRVLHFKDADAWISYNDEFGNGNIFMSLISHQQRAAAHASQMQIFGPNPEVMLQSVLDELRVSVRNDPKMKEADKSKQINLLDIGQGGSSQKRLGSAFLEMQGLTMSPASISSAKINQGIRNVQAMSKLGGAVITALPTDVVTTGAAAMFRGGGFARGLANSIEQLLAGHKKTERKEITYLLGEGFDGLISEITSPHFATDGFPGHLNNMANAFFRWNGLTGWTDRVRGAAGRVVSAEMGMRSKTSFDKLPDAYRHVLGLNGIDAPMWDAIRSVGQRAENGNNYITPDLMANIPDEALDDVIAGRMADIQSQTKDPVRLEKARKRFTNDARAEIELAVGRFIADETSFGVVETDAASRRISLRGTRPGTFAGEALRYVVQFKGFPIAFSQRVVGRALFGGQGATKGERIMAGLPHLGTLLTSLTAAGYASMVMKDTLKGNWPPRDISDPKVLAAAALQGGALGIYGDFLFGEANRFGNSALETVAGPSVSTAANVVNLYQSAIRGEASAAQGLNLILNNTPFLNLFYVKPALDYVFLNSLREMASPGYKRRQQRRLREDRGQSNFLS